MTLLIEKLSNEVNDDISPINFDPSTGDNMFLLQTFNQKVEESFRY